MLDVIASPLISKSDFDAACDELSRLFAERHNLQSEWLSVDVHDRNDTRFLRIMKPLCTRVDVALGDSQEQSDERELMEYDEEALEPSPSHQGVVVEYDIVFSPSFQVPVLYFNIKDLLFRFPPTMDTLYRHLIPLQFRSQAEKAGVIGGITLTDHPLTNAPVFFVHPCQTVSILGASRGKEELTPIEFLMLWISAMGGCVGLHLPIALAEK
ncbi:uncharacterized protein BDR25DRAFT_384036 [Lindgomyces ingoldianus]|uniref:Uncharacterized protein n=1 Tax=Lindgomyces ingoldianus TaxID=673940 RepID=A0ACB6R670_9PLEO|nr:uncharacterized protein BDR25DRAFT_384036 [Lindgomyces ingoldianus]KAF2474656.1 hypothetical protein BDR25DRAFT_384036 [Lindgomyces ingoldianus]